MEDQCTPLSWDFFHEDEGMEELWHSVLHKTMELEKRVCSGKDEIIKKEDELDNLKDFLNRAIRERDEAESKCQSIMLDIVALQHQLQNPFKPQKQQPNGPQIIPPMPSTDLPPAAEKFLAGKTLPEKGKLLQAVMEAGPLLQTLLLAGPLPQWQHPPPRVDSVEIPPVAISLPQPPKSGFGEDYLACLGRKRSLALSEGSVFPSNTKCQKVALF